MIAAPWYEPILRGLGAVLAFLYELVPNYGVAIILLTLGIRLLLLPLGIKQVRSMHAMQALAPKMKALQQKYKGNRQKLAEEQMKLYKEHGASPLGGCLPMLLQIPVLIALFAVLRFPGGVDRIPESSELRAAIESQQTDFLGANLLCAPSQAGGGAVELPPGQESRTDRPLDCGTGFPVRIPHYLLLAAMVGTTFYQSWQMQRASPTANPQQQLISRIMPVFFGFIGFTFPAGLIVYWTTTNLVQIGQQHFMLPKRAEGAEAGKAQATGNGGRKPSRPRDRSAATQRRRRELGTEERAGRRRRASEAGQGTGRRRSQGSDGRHPQAGSGSQEGGESAGKGTAGERHGRSRKKRRKR
jgi:YidC/Oxa1 family membrane protein insertase